MKTRQPPPTENKLLLLYVLRALGPMTADQINRLSIELRLMDYIDLQLSLAELMDAGLTLKYTDDTGLCYLLSARGKQALAMFEPRLPASRLQDAQALMEKWKVLLRNEKHLRADWTYRPQTRDYSARLRVLEGGNTLVDMTLCVATAEEARALCRNWQTRATKACTGLFETLSDARKIDT